ncbi:MAG: hypothetical protein R3F56_06410 [Planctomycetota bacterium]
MVKKTSLLDKLVGRWRTSAGVEVHEGSRATSGSSSTTSRISGQQPSSKAQTGLPAQPKAQARPVEPEVAEVLAQPMLDRASGRKLSVKEEALLTMDGGLKELASLMRGVQVRLDAEGAQVGALAEDIKLLPALGQAQLEALRAVAAQLEQQGLTNERLVQSVADLPAALTGLRATLDRVVATDERTASTLSEFRTAMDSIHSAMRETVEHARAQGERSDSALRAQDARAERVVESLQQVVRGQQDRTERLASSVEQLASGQQGQADRLARSVDAAITSAVQGVNRDGGELRDAVKGLQRSHEDSSKALRLAHEDQATRLQRIVEDGQRGNRNTLVVLVLIFVAILAAAGLLLFR